MYLYAEDLTILGVILYTRFLPYVRLKIDMVWVRGGKMEDFVEDFSHERVEYISREDLSLILCDTTEDKI